WSDLYFGWAVRLTTRWFSQGFDQRLPNLVGVWRFMDQFKGKNLTRRAADDYDHPGPDRLAAHLDGGGYGPSSQLPHIERLGQTLQPVSLWRIRPLEGRRLSRFRFLSSVSGGLSQPHTGCCAGSSSCRPSHSSA